MKNDYIDDKNLIFLSREPYLRDDVRFKSDPETYIWQEEMSSFMDWTNEHEPDGSWWLVEQGNA